MHISNYKTFLNFLETYADHSKTRIFRGVSSNKYKLIPSIGRLLNKDDKTKLTEDDEDLIFRFFKQRSQPFLTKEYDDMNLLAIAQHHGLPTRLLDWTFNPLAAAYFAVENSIAESSNTEHSVIYVYNKRLDIKVDKQFESIKVDKLDLFVPNYNDDRIINQNGLFTVHPYPWEEFIDSDIVKVTIDLKFRRQLRINLNRLGVNQATIYPGLDGVAGNIKWMTTNYY